MTAVHLNDAALRHIKKNLEPHFTNVGSSHLTEAIARALGFNSNASLLAYLHKIDATAFEASCFDTVALLLRLAELGYSEYESVNPKLFVNVETSMIDGKHAFKTAPEKAHKIKYDSPRRKAWRNLMVTAINAGLAQKLFSLKESDTKGLVVEQKWATCEFVIAGFPALAFFRDVGYGELSVHAAVNPTGKYISSGNAGFNAGEAFANSWLERHSGFWLQTNDSWVCRKHLVSLLADVSVEPKGYGDRGKVIM